MSEGGGEGAELLTVVGNHQVQKSVLGESGGHGGEIVCRERRDKSLSPRSVYTDCLTICTAGQ